MDAPHIGFLLFPGMTQLDMTGPAQFLSRLGGPTDYLAGTRDPVPTDSGFAIVPTATFDEVSAVDILCVPGGVGVADVMEDARAIDWVERAGAGAAWVTSVCTGSLILGAAGLLRGYRATTHWAWMDHLAAFGAEPTPERVVFDRNRVTGGGVTSGIDFGLALVAAIRGERAARMLQLALEYDPAPAFASGSPRVADPELVAAVRKLGEAAAPDRARRFSEAAERLARR